MLFRRDDKINTSARKEAIQMAEILVKTKKRHVNSFIQHGGLGSIRDLLLESVDRPKEQKKDNKDTSMQVTCKLVSLIIISIYLIIQYGITLYAEQY